MAPEPVEQKERMTVDVAVGLKEYNPVATKARWKAYKQAALKDGKEAAASV